MEEGRRLCDGRSGGWYWWREEEV
ncbi:hypothetical protein A2U01_0071989, partial [Trifolium medium]|nr:hypothetical protein [Trifolium medium]